MPKIVDYESKKQEIIEKAKKVFVKRGYHNTNLSHISKKCGMGRTTIYQYFKNKDEIFYHTVDSILEEILTKVETIAADKQLTSAEKLKKIVRQLIDEQKNNNTLIILLEVWLILKRNDDETFGSLKKYIQRLRKTIKELIKEAIDTTKIKLIDDKSLTEMIKTFIEALYFNEFITI